jgi:hypothetical protein
MQFSPVTTLWGGRTNYAVFGFVALNGTHRCKKKKIKKNTTREQQELQLDLDSTLTAEAEGQVEAKGNEVEEQDATDAVASGICACTHPLTFAIVWLLPTMLKIKLKVRFY